MNQNSPETGGAKKSKVFSAAKWILGIIIVWIGGEICRATVFVGTAVILYGIVILPPVQKKLLELRTKKEAADAASTTKKCPACKEEIAKDAKVCKHCGKKQPMKMSKNTALAVVILFIAFTVSTGVSIGNDIAPVQHAATPVQVTTSVPVPASSQQGLSTAIGTLLAQNSSQFSAKDVTIDTDTDDESAYPRPAGAEYVTIDINANDGNFLTDNDIVTGTGTFSAQLFQKVFLVDPNFYDVLIRYYGQTTDQYGNSTTNLLLSYEMDRPLYEKIDWSGFAGTGNELDLCAFIREDFNAMSQADQDSSYVGCAILATNLRTAESTIETSNPAFSDIPQYK